MCGLCGALGIEGDWTDAAATPLSGARTVRAQRLERVHVVNTVLKQFSLVLSDWEGAKYQLRSQARARARCTTPRCLVRWKSSFFDPDAGRHRPLVFDRDCRRVL